MSIDLTGIENQNEFYTHHYLAAILEQDLKDVFRKWRERDEIEKVRPPFAELRGLAKDYFATRSQLERQRATSARLEQQRGIESLLLEALGYPFSPALKDLDDEVRLPILGEIKKPNGAPELWVLEAVDEGGEQQDPMTLCLLACQYPEGAGVPAELAEASFDEIITRHVFGRAEPPRWVLLASLAQLVLIDRGKWNEKRLLRFDLGEILGRREARTLQAAAALLHRDSVCPAEGLCLLDSLDENSHKHAHAVSEDLKYALREAIELLGNEVVYYRRQTHQALFEGSKDEIDARELTLECLRYMYRLLFLFYIEARPELGYAPMKADAYRKGCSLESLRDIELVKLTTEESRNGTFLSDSLALLFRLVYEGFQPREKGMKQLALAAEGKALHNTFELTPLRTHLFDPRRTPLLNGVRIRNAILQRVVELMSLSSPEGHERRGRVSYAQLGINQLGAVYEALLSFSGFFAQTDLYEVKKADEEADALATAYFVPEEDLADYAEQERVYDDDGKLRKYAKGTFIYRLAGRNRETSASYYTPEVLTQCLVKYALKELLPGKSADEILQLTVCEPAVGSAAFLNEAVNQLADAYLDAKQKDLGRKLLLAAPRPEDQDPADPYRQTEDYVAIKQRVKTFIADNRVFGVDLNPVAVELAEVSLWLNTMAPGGFIPWFGNQLACGNSLVGARRQVFQRSLLDAKKAGWLGEVPERIRVGKPRPPGSVYHFLLGDEGMSVYGEGNEGKPIKEMSARQLEAIKRWRSEFCAPLSRGEVDALVDLSDAIDKLWLAHIGQQRRIRARTTDPMPIWGQSAPAETRAPTTTEWKDAVLFRELYSKGVRSSSPYRRLKLVMDYWCALWFWPIEKAELLPSRGELLLELSLILRGDVLELAKPGQQLLPLFSDTQPKDEATRLIDEFGFVNVDKLCESYPRLALVEQLATARLRFLHWELEFADQFADKGGFDLLLGNPPWIKVQWKEVDILGDFEPLLALRGLSAKQAHDSQASILSKKSTYDAYVTSHEHAAGIHTFLTGMANYGVLAGIQANLYKCFVVQSAALSNRAGVFALVHQPGVYDDARGGALRAVLTPRIRLLARFQNWLDLFAIMKTKEFCLSVFAAPRLPRFTLVANLVHPKTLDQCFEHDGRGPVPQVKTADGAWEVRGHRSRLIDVDTDVLKLFSRLYDEPDTPWGEARLPIVHSADVLGILRKFSTVPATRLLDLDHFSTEHFHETNQQKDGTIRRTTGFPESVQEWIVSGPSIFVGTPMYKTPNRDCRNARDYSPLDLLDIPDGYLPRANHRRACSRSEYERRTPRWNDGAVTDYYRWVCRKMISPSSERTLACSVLPPGAAHIGGVFSIAIEDPVLLMDFCATTQSVVVDFFTKTTGKENFHSDIARQIPIVRDPHARARALRLNCVTAHYSRLWAAVYDRSLRAEAFAVSRPCFGSWRELTDVWNGRCPLRNALERRQALLEIDVLCGRELGLSLEELLSLYRAQFPVLRKLESETFYDQRGRIVFTTNEGLPGLGLPRSSRSGPCWEDVRDMRAGVVERVVQDDTLPGGPRKKTIVYHAPFDRCDRERDYEVVWAEFEKRYGKLRTKK